MGDFICPYACSYRTNSGFCGYTGGYEACQYRRINGFDYESKQFYAEPVKTPEERYVWPPRTWGDKIRSMTDEELAHLLHSAEEHLFTGNLWNYEKWTKWLKQEAANDNDDH